MCLRASCGRFQGLRGIEGLGAGSMLGLLHHVSQEIRDGCHFLTILTLLVLVLHGPARLVHSIRLGYGKLGLNFVLDVALGDDPGTPDGIALDLHGPGHSRG